MKTASEKCNVMHAPAFQSHKLYLAGVNITSDSIWFLNIGFHAEHATKRHQ
uniref:Uncharacterized protein n=1 Tax=Anguilla anguilla TaxID=7936 RepID=A0A0E9RV42_ANGAN